MLEKPSQPIDIFCHADPVAQHEDRVKAAAVELKHIGLAHISNSLFAHDLNRLRGYVDGTDPESSSLKDKGMMAGSGADIQNVAPAAVERSSAPGQ